MIDDPSGTVKKEKQNIIKTIYFSDLFTHNASESSIGLIVMELEIDC